MYMFVTNNKLLNNNNVEMNIRSDKAGLVKP